MKNPITHFIGMAFCLLMISYAQAYHQPFPDTGQSKCYNNEQEITCPQPGEPFFGQDAQYQPRLPRSYTRLKSGGSPWLEGLDFPEQWLMTKDNVTGLTWEVKTDEPGLRSKNNTYTWYNPGLLDPGVQDGGVCSGSSCDTYSYIKTLNDQNFGQRSNWRVPGWQELTSLVHWDRHLPAINFRWFPETKSSSYWTSTLLAQAMCRAGSIHFALGNQSYSEKKMQYRIRAVSESDQVLSHIQDNQDGTISTTKTGLMWSKCSCGQEWDGNQCLGEPESKSWEGALACAEEMDMAGQTDWRLPNINELQSLVHRGYPSPAISVLFQNETMSTYYWTSTTLNDTPGFKWAVDFGAGEVTAISGYDAYYARPVRGGTTHIPTELQLTNQLFDLLESVFPLVLSPAPQLTVESDGIFYRSYSDTKLTVGIVEDDLYLRDHTDEVYYLGKADFWLEYTKAETIFNWLESEYPHVLTPSSQPTHILDGIIYRCYQDTNVCIATLDDDLFYYIVDNDELYNPGNVDSLLPYAQ